MPRQKHPDIEVRAGAVHLFLAAFDVFPSLAQKYLTVRGFACFNQDGKLRLDTAYLPLDLWLDTFEAVMRDIGHNALFKIGQHGVRNPNFPLSVHDLESALREVDIAYHLSHRKGGVTMLDRVTGTMLEGIGHYTVQRDSTEKKIQVCSDTPYPCPLEHGLLSGITAMFEPRAALIHAPGPCRLSGGSICLYTVRR